MSRQYETERFDPALDEAMRRYYDERAPEYDDWYERRGRYDNPATNHLWHEDMEKLAQYADDFGQGHLLDLATGTAYWTPRFMARPEVTELTLFDQSSGMLDQAMQRLRGVDKPIHAVQGNIYNLPFADNMFDSCFMGHLFGHVPPTDQPRFLEGLRRVMRPGSKVMVFDALWVPSRNPSEIEVQNRPLKDGSVHPVLKIYFTLDSFKNALQPLAQNGSLEVASTGNFFVVAHITIGQK